MVEFAILYKKEQINRKGLPNTMCLSQAIGKYYPLSLFGKLRLFLTDTFRELETIRAEPKVN
jgi:hypothetical protein